MASVAAYLAAQLGISLGAGFVEDAANIAALEAAGPEAIARALERGAQDPEVAVACIDVAVLALELAPECDLDDRGDRLLRRVGFHVRGDAAWVTVLVDAANAAALDALARFARLPAPGGRGIRLRDPAPARPARRCARTRGDGGARRDRAAPGDRACASPGSSTRIGARGCGASHHRGARGSARALVRRGCAAARAAITARSIRSLRCCATMACRAPTKAPAARALERLRAFTAAPALIALVEARPPPNELAAYVSALRLLDPVGAAPIVVRIVSPNEVNAQVVAIAEAGARAGDEESLAFLRRAARAMPHWAARSAGR